MTQPDERTRTLSGPSTLSPEHDEQRPLTERLTEGAGSVRAEQPRTHPIAYLALVLSVIALIGLAVVSGGDDGYQLVKVGSQDCVSVPQDSGPSVLYCKTSTTIK